MQRIWATAATVWAVLGVTAALAWTQAQHATPAAVPATNAATTAKGTSLSTAAVSAPAHATTRTS